MTDSDVPPRDGKVLSPLVRALDALSIALFLFAFVIHVGGGFRVRVGDLRVSFLSWVPPMAVGFALLIARHWWWARPSVLSRLVRVYRRVTSSVSWQETWGIFVATRVAVLVVGLLAIYTIGYPDEVPNFRVSKSEALNLPARWDAGWYLNIASGGYRWDPQRQERQQNIAFFPGYPLAIYLLGRFFGGSITAHVTAAVLLSHAAFLWALFYLFRLSRDLCGDGHRARDVILLIATYPFAVFYGAIYTESIFLLGAVGAIYEFNARRWGRAAAWGLIVGLTRPNGFMLALTLAAFGLAQRIWTRRDSSVRGRLAALAAVAAPVLGVALYSIYIWALTGNPLQWSAQHAAWGRTFTGAAPFVRSAEVCRRARIRALCPQLAVRGNQRRRGNIRACDGNPRGTAAGHSVRHLPPVQPRAAAAGRRLHVDRTCDRNDVPDLHMAGDRPIHENDRRRGHRVCHASGAGRGALLHVASVCLKSTSRRTRIGHGQTRIRSVTDKRGSDRSRTMRIRSVTDYADVHGQEDFRVVCVEPQRPGVAGAVVKIPHIIRHDTEMR